MRELSAQELPLVSGSGLYSDYSPHEIAPLSAMAGYLVGAHIKSWKESTHRSSMDGVINAISLCARRLEVAREVTFHYLRQTRGINAFTHFGCGIVMGLTERTSKSSKS